MLDTKHAFPDVMPSITAVIPCWNAERWVGQAIQSVIDQNYRNLQIVVIDDGSIDNSLKIIKSFGRKIYWETGANYGACEARNRGAEITQSDFLFFLDADDYIEGEFLAELSRGMVETGAQLALGPIMLNTDGRLHSQRSFSSNSTKEQLIRSIVRYEGPQTGAVLWKRDLFNRVGGWDPQLLRLQDYFLLLLTLSRCSCFTLSQTGAFVHRQHSSADRVSSQRNILTELSVVHAYQKYIHSFEKFLLEEDRFFLAEQIYWTSVQLNRWNRKTEAEIGFALSERLGLRGHAGSPLHRLVCTFFGLDFKEWLSELKRSVWPSSNMDR